MTSPEKPRSKMLELKERRGPVSPELLESVRQNNAARPRSRRRSPAGPLTVPEIAEAAGLSPDDPLDRHGHAQVRLGRRGLHRRFVPRYALAAKDPR
jgi:hypothetical protein